MLVLVVIIDLKDRLVPAKDNVIVKGSLGEFVLFSV